MDDFRGDEGREDEEDPTDRCLDLAEGISGLRPFIRGAEESLGGVVEDEAEDTFGDVEICGGVDSVSGDGTIGGPGADVGDSEIAGAAETRGGVVSLVRDADTAAGDVDAES